MPIQCVCVHLVLSNDGKRMMRIQLLIGMHGINRVPPVQVQIARSPIAAKLL